MPGWNEFKQTRGITLAKVKARHREHLVFLRANIRPDGIAMTHFAPSWQPISPKDGASDVAGYYASDLEDLILRKRPAIWVHGHIHARCDYPIGETRVICNPARYEGRDHEPRLVIKLL